MGSNILNEFYIRYAAKPFETFYKTTGEDNKDTVIKFYKDNFKNDILLTSHSLYKSLCDENGNDKAYESLVKYIIRSATRCTPYSTLAGVLLGEFSKHDKKTLINNSYVKIQADCEWLISLISVLENELSNQLFIKFNSDVTVENKKIINSWLSCFYKDDIFDKDSIVINNTNAVKLIFEYGKNYIRRGDLLIKMMTAYPNISPEYIQNLIDRLLKYEVLISNLRFNLLNNDILGNIIKICRKSEYTCDTLSKILYIYNFLDNINVKEKVSNFDAITTLMGSICSSNNLLKVDSYSRDVIFLDDEYKATITDYFNFLSKYAIKFENYSIHLGKFIEKFGYVKVPIKIAFDADVGIGLPAKEDMSRQYFQNVFENEISKLMSEVNNHEKIIHLEQLHKNNVYTNQKKGSCELAFYPIVEKGKTLFITSPFIGANNIFQSFGRFKYLFDSEKNISPCLDETDSVEIVFMPKKSRIANVTNCLSDCRWYLEFGSDNAIQDKKRLTLDDILVTTDGSNFIYINRVTNNKINFYLNSRVSHDYMPNLLNFILSSCNSNLYNYVEFFSLLTNYLNGLNEWPEVWYKNILVSPKVWFLKDKIFKKSEMVSQDDFNNVIKEMIRNRRIDSMVFFENLDNRLLLNLNDTLHIKLLYKLFKKTPDGRLVKNYFTNENLIVYDKNGKKHLAEYVFQCYNNSSDATHQVFREYPEYSSTNKRLLAPFQEWIYFKINMRSIYYDYYINECLRGYLNNIKYKDRIISDFFFIRYRESKDQLRLRIKFNDKRGLLDSILPFLDESIDDQYIISYSIETYEREYERYGFEKIEIFEKIFSINSEFTFDILHQITNKELNFSKEEIYIISLLFMFDRLNLNPLKELSCFKISNDYKKDYRDIYNRIKKTIEPSNNYEGLRSIYTGLELYILMDKNFGMMKDVIEEQDDLAINDFILSLMHMYFNRLIGINREKEIKLNSFVEKILYSLERRKQYNEG